MTGATATKRPDGSYEVEGHIIRKATQDDVYDAYADQRGRTMRKLPAAPKPHGWVVEHEDFSYPQPVATLKDGEDLVRRHAHGYWYSRCETFAMALDDAEPATGAEDTEVVLRLIVACKLTYDDFRELDEHPGHFTVNGRSYTSDGSRWHSRLRRTRNSRRELFDLLAR